MKTLNNFSARAFLETYWQKKPLLIKQAFTNWQNPLSADELAGLSLDDTIESRIVVTEPSSNQESTQQISNYQLFHGPFSEDSFTGLDKQIWTLLVQAVDHYIEPVASIIDYFQFIPQWQIDDIMVSYANRGGSVGPHFDRYDVFLIQGAGRREWRLGQQCTAQTATHNSDGLTLLQDFDEQLRYELEPGDILYVPPYLAHWGCALDDDCMTYSLGFRAPSHAELLDTLTQSAIQKLNEDDRFRALINPQLNSHPATIDSHTIAQLKSLLQDTIFTTEHLSQWFAQWASLGKYQDPLEATQECLNDTDYIRPGIDKTDSLHFWQRFDEFIPADQSQEHCIFREASKRFLLTESDTACCLFIDGSEQYRFNMINHREEIDLLYYLLSQHSFSLDTLKARCKTPAQQQLLKSWFDDGYLSLLN